MIALSTAIIKSGDKAAPGFGACAPVLATAPGIAEVIDIEDVDVPGAPLLPPLPPAVVTVEDDEGLADEESSVAMDFQWYPVEGWNSVITRASLNALST